MHYHYSPALIVHIAGGIVAVLSGYVALLNRKGSHAHRTAGNIFVISMIVMGAFGGFIAAMKADRANTLGGILAIYLVSSAWLTARRKDHEIGKAEFALLAVVLALISTSIWFGISGASHPAVARRSGAAVAWFIFATIFTLFAVSDVRNIVSGGFAGAQRIARHLVRMGVGLFTATGSFFLGTAGDPIAKKAGLRAQLFTPEIRATHLPLVPVLLVLILTIYWLIRVKRGAARPKSRAVTVGAS